MQRPSLLPACLALVDATAASSLLAAARGGPVSIASLPFAPAAYEGESDRQLKARRAKAG